MVLAAGVPAVYKRAAWSVNYSDRGARGRSFRLDRAVWFKLNTSELLQPSSCYNQCRNSQQYGK